MKLSINTEKTIKNFGHVFSDSLKPLTTHSKNIIAFCLLRTQARNSDQFSVRI